jgi:hypothetical protein
MILWSVLTLKDYLWIKYLKVVNQLVIKKNLLNVKTILILRWLVLFVCLETKAQNLGILVEPEKTEEPPSEEESEEPEQEK